jgi:hypothetical protein
MGFLGLLGIIGLAFFVIIIYFVITGIKQKNWKRIVIPIVIFIGIAVLTYLALIFFITSM